MAKSPLNEIARRVRADVWLLLVMATSAGALGLALSIPGRADAGRALAATACVALLATGFTAWQGSRTFAELEAFDDVAGFALSDSLARPEVTGRLESMEKLSPDVRRRWVLATAYHLAGDRARADGLYAEAGLDSRAKRNRSALLEARGPVEFPSAPEVAAALTPGAALPAAQSSDAPIALLLGPALLAWAALAIAVLVRYLGWKPTLPHWLAFVTHVAIPGARELARGAPTRGWATLALAAGIGWVLLFANIKRGAVGVFTCRAIPDYWPPTVPGPLEAYRWTAFWAVPYARLVWPLLLAGALLLIAEHGRVVLAAWKERAAVPTGR